MKLNRIVAFAVLVVCLTLGTSAFLPPSSACSGGGQPGSCREATHPGDDNDDQGRGVLARLVDWLESFA